MNVKTTLNHDGQPLNKRFNFSRNRSKAAYVLRGILQGVIADQKLNDAEVLFLDTWMRSQQYLEDTGDVIDLLDFIGDILEDGYISETELLEIKSVIEDIIEYGKQQSDIKEDNINELSGILLGMAADGRLTDGEFKNLDTWLCENEHLSNLYPANVLIDKINQIKEDGIVDKEEKEDLLELINNITGQRFIETGDAEGAVAEVFSENIKSIDHSNKKICFTGKFVCGSRKVCENTAKDKGAIIAKSVTQD